MRKIRDVLRLAFDCKMSNRRIAKGLGISRSVVSDYLIRFSTSKLAWPLPEDLDDAALGLRLLPPHSVADLVQNHEPSWMKIHEDMKKKGATRQVLYDEHVRDQGYDMSYTTFCRGYRRFKKTLRRYMRQVHKAGEKVFVDFGGKTLTITDLATGHNHQAHIFCGVLGASRYTYAEAVWSQELEHWVGAHARMFAFFGGVPKMVICDNLKAGVTKASRTDPEINATYLDMAAHYGTMIFPARPYEPQDKSPAENGVLLIQRWILFRLRNRTFVSIPEANAAIRELLRELNARPFQKLDGSRLTLFEAIERLALLSLPRDSYIYCEFHKARIGPDYHFDIEGHHYSVPYRLIGKEVEVRLTVQTVEAFDRGKRVASHPRSRMAGETTTSPEHMDPQHRHYSQWNPQRALEWGMEVGVQTHALIQLLLAKHKAVEMSYRSIASLQKLGNECGFDRLETACGLGLKNRADKVDRIRSILKHKLDLTCPREEGEQEADFDHSNIRGPQYYQ